MEQEQAPIVEQILTDGGELLQITETVTQTRTVDLSLLQEEIDSIRYNLSVYTQKLADKEAELASYKALDISKVIDQKGV